MSADTFPDWRRPLVGPDSVAVSHIAWAVSAGLTAAEVAAAHAMPYPHRVTWQQIRAWIRSQQASRRAA